jgi:hypothetical protein
MNDLLRTAVLGTGQVPPGADATGTAADGLVDKLGVPERERALLLRVGSASVLQRAGRRPLAFTGVVEPAPRETLTRASARLSDLLSQVVQGAFSELLLEAAQAMQLRELRLPEEMLPTALSERYPERRAALLPLLGERGRWLAKQRPEWAWAHSFVDSTDAALPTDAEARWQEGSTAERTQLLKLARRLDPALGRTWVESTFKTDKPEQRVAWLEAFEAGLCDDDVAFVASALADRSGNVRLAAARVLWRLPKTEVARAVQARVESLFPIAPPEGGLLNKLKSTLVETKPLRALLPPEEYDKALDKLGVAEAPPHTSVGRRQWWLAQLVAATPPAWFCERFGAAPEALLEAAKQHDYRDALVNGWASAAFRFDAAGWHSPLWDACFRLQGLANWFGGDTLRRLTIALTPEARTQRLVTCVRDGVHLDLLDLADKPWPEALSQTALGRLRPESWQGRHLLGLAATQLPLDLLPATLTPLEGTSPSYVKLIEEFNFRADFRRRLAEELRT